MSYTSNIWLYPLQDWWKTVNEMSNFMSTGQMGNFIFRPVIILHRQSNFQLMLFRHVYFIPDMVLTLKSHAVHVVCV